MERPGKQSNRLVQETSPYLLQHAYNPVDWHPWGEEALARARREDKPILLSIGYSACHWCHVMERESFESEEIADLMNQHFINIKVDREERPDLDAIYMNFVQLTTGHGGWPLTVFLDPDQVPFFGGTYFPPEDHYGRPGFKRILLSIADVFKNRRAELEQNREEIMTRLQASGRMSSEQAEPGGDVLEAAYKSLRDAFDPNHGGFGHAPKFPGAMALAFLLRHHRRHGQSPALEMVTLSLQEMARGGIYDQLGGGFHRYSVDERWLVPHFEKMLYDNALLARLYLEAFQITGDPFYREVVEETLAYVEREMTDPSGGFYSAQDADSEGEEGKFFVWTPAEVEAVLGSEEARIFKDQFDVTESGNFEGKNILHQRIELTAQAKNLGISAEQLKARLDASRQALWRVREKRVKPGLDDKILAAWNGLMLTAFARAGFVLNDPRWTSLAVINAEFLWTSLFREDRLFRSFKNKEARLNGYLEDYALVVEGWIHTYYACGDPVWLERAARLTDLQLERFWDEEEGDFFFTSSDHENLIVRQKEYFDNATPSGNSVSCLNLLQLALLTGKSDYRERAVRMLRNMAAVMTRYPLGFGYWLQALDFHLGPVQEVAVVGPEEGREKLLDSLRKHYLPNAVVASASEVDEALGNAIPLLQGKGALDGKAAAYLCRNYSCRQPVTSGEELEQLIVAG